MKVVGLEGLTNEEVANELARGGRFVIFPYVVSVLIMTFKRSSDVHFVRAGESALVKSLPYTAISLVAGWWGIPWGLIYTPGAIITNLRGGKDVTAEVTRSASGAR